VGRSQGSAGCWPPEDFDDLWDRGDGPGECGWTIFVIIVAILVIFGFWFWDDYHHATSSTTTPGPEALGSVIEFEAPFDDSSPAHHIWQWELTDHVNTSAGSIDLGDMVWSVSGSASGSVINLTAYDAGAIREAAVWAFPGGWTFMTGYSADTLVGNQFLFVVNGSNNLDGVTVTLQCPGGEPYSGSVAVTISN
jgi:hypothetical protein